MRRRSIDSGVHGSPCVNLERIERKKSTALQHLAKVLRFDHGVDELPPSVADRLPKISPDKVILTKPSIASTSSQQFGGDLLIRAGHGLLERQSLEENALMAHGEDIIVSCKSIGRSPKCDTDGALHSGKHQGILTSRPSHSLSFKHSYQLRGRDAAAVCLRQLLNL